MKLDRNAPPEFGELRFSLGMPPASRQATAASRQRVTNAVRAVTSPLRYLLDGYVWISFDWHIHERFRWESDASADVDNIVKPLLDALCGPDGVLVDDSQVKSFSSSWFSSINDEQRVDIEIKFIDQEWLQKEGLVFVRLKGALCYPVPASVRENNLEVWLDWLKSVQASRETLAVATGDYYPARYLMSHGYFHRTRLRDFTIIDLAELETEARTKLAN